jgi:hypothetical protein
MIQIPSLITYQRTGKRGNETLKDREVNKRTEVQIEQ